MPAVAPMPIFARGCHQVARDARSSGSCAFNWSYTANDTARYGTTVAPDSTTPLYSPAPATNSSASAAHFAVITDFTNAGIPSLVYGCQHHSQQKGLLSVSTVCCSNATKDLFDGCWTEVASTELVNEMLGTCLMCVSLVTAVCAVKGSKVPQCTSQVLVVVSL